MSIDFYIYDCVESGVVENEIECTNNNAVSVLLLLLLLEVLMVLTCWRRWICHYYVLTTKLSWTGKYSFVLWRMRRWGKKHYYLLPSFDQESQWVRKLVMVTWNDVSDSRWGSIILFGAPLVCWCCRERSCSSSVPCFLSFKTIRRRALLKY